MSTLDDECLQILQLLTHSRATAATHWVIDQKEIWEVRCSMQLCLAGLTHPLQNCREEITLHIGALPAPSDNFIYCFAVAKLREVARELEIDV